MHVPFRPAGGDFTGGLPTPAISYLQPQIFGRQQASAQELSLFSPTFNNLTVRGSQSVSGSFTLSGAARINNTIGINGAAVSNAVIYSYENVAIPSSSGGAYGFRCLLLSDSSATSSMIAYEGRIYTPNLSFTLTDATTYFANAPSKGASNTITNWYGFRAGNGNSATNNYGFYTSQAASSGVWAFYATAAKSYFGGTVDIAGTAASTSASTLNLGASTQSTVGANGAASALTANPLGYLVAYLGTTKIAIPYYNG